MKAITDDEIESLKNVDKELHSENRESLATDLRLYKEIGSRNDYLFDWLLYIFENVHLPSIDEKYYKSLCVAKTELSIFDVLIDDIADKSEERNEALLHELIKIPFHYTSINLSILESKRKKYLLTAKKIWDNFEERIKEYPRYTEFKKIFVFDVNQLLNSMHYGYLVNTHKNLGNSIENSAYGHHSMIVILQGMLDLMCSPKFDVQELNKVRKAMFLSQKMARIGNMINTYPKEILEKDVTSDIILDSIEKGIIDFDDVSAEKIESLLDSLSQEQNNYDLKWSEMLREVKKLCKEIKSIDMSHYIFGIVFAHQKYLNRGQYWKSEYKDKKHVN